jgi:hypothetical protein
MMTTLDTEAFEEAVGEDAAAAAADAPGSLLLLSSSSSSSLSMSLSLRCRSKSPRRRNGEGLREIDRPRWTDGDLDRDLLGLGRAM